MDYGMIGKIEKAKLYSEERERIRFDSFRVSINGDNDAHYVTYDQGNWDCDCEFFASRYDKMILNPNKIKTHALSVRYLAEPLSDADGAPSCMYKV